METGKKINIFVNSFLLALILLVISLATFMFYLYQERSLEFLKIREIQPVSIFIELGAAAVCFAISFIFFIDVIRHPSPWKQN